MLFWEAKTTPNCNSLECPHSTLFWVPLSRPICTGGESTATRFMLLTTAIGMASHFATYLKFADNLRPQKLCETSGKHLKHKSCRVFIADRRSQCAGLRGKLYAMHHEHSCYARHQLVVEHHLQTNSVPIIITFRSFLFPFFLLLLLFLFSLANCNYHDAVRALRVERV